ncbi:peptidoglycan hydrolase CwlO-like protein [Pseudarthrobacter oxydans]|uniref:Peptidoglycan hydrolase CwlO-like protein n=1 Tax=Pseudarthrobacter oxydans TaxID=1671 RepID=A0AAW8NCU7_PSEOX|nr:hypothetical protein [Pseudarthrobacter oxydans]MDR6794369.1 peptidoglycan hydrolase CwlO-like protein [Pseudarthrobacter oxydans]MDR7164856.1 peptidoglycan hydrolase CwlO-like protein [Pseudarthrobacter oxydans]
MTLKAKLPTFEKGSADLGKQLREQLAVVVELCEAIERLEAALAPKEADTSAGDEGAEGEPEDKQEAPEAASDESAEEKAPAATKPASKPATRASAK